jgi:SecD/SecF fusion protein
MQRNFTRGLLICLIPCLLAALFAVRPEKYRLGIDLAGGTILVYEINTKRTAERKASAAESTQNANTPAKAKGRSATGEGLTSDEMTQLAGQIKRRIDPTDIKNVTVRPLGDNRVEIILPMSGASSGKSNLSNEEIEEVKRLISQMGVLEFRILANGKDDEEGIRAARVKLESKSAGELETRAKLGLPPESPEDFFNVDINDTKARTRYLWVEIGPEERVSLGLSNAAENGEGRTGLWATLAAERDKPVPILNGGRVDPVSCNMLLYSRKCVSAEQLAKEKMDFDRLKGQNPGKTDEEIEAMMNRKKYEYFILTRVSPLDSVRVEEAITITANVGTDSKSFKPCVEFTFNSEGGRRFSEITRRNKPTGSHLRNLAIVLDERVVSAPNLQSEIGNRGQITGQFDRKTVERLVQILRSGALTAELREKPVSENAIGPTLGADTIRRGTMAIALAFVAVLAFMVIYYRFAGFVACVALFANLLLTVGFMVAVNAAFTLPGLAGLVLTLGIAVDANVLIYERLREERNKGVNIATAIRNGYDRAFATIIDTHLTSIFTAIVLYALGNDNLKGFAISLTVGLIISLFTSLYMTRLMFDFWLHKRWLNELRMMKLFEKPNFRPMKYRAVFFTVTGVLTVAGLGLFLLRGDKGLNVDFRGGTVFAGKLKDGEERGLTTTADGKPGFRELFGEEAQKTKLAVESVVWVNKPSGDALVNTWDYTITYADKTKATVTLTEKPAGDTPEAMAEDVKARASKLPDVSVEQTFLSTDNFGMGKSRLFTLRTTEKQRGLVQAALDRLLRVEGVSMMAGGTMTHDPVTGNIVKLRFDKPTSLAFTNELFTREFKNRLAAEAGVENFTLKGDDAPVDGRFKEMTLDVSRNPTLQALKNPKDPQFGAELQALQSVVNATKQAFDSTPEPERLEVFDSQLASETRETAFKAIVVSWLAILLYLWFRFGNWTFGLAAVICLIHDLCFTLGAIAACHYLHLVPGFEYLGIQDFKIDLAAVAALLTLVGYSVSDTIVVFDRIREVRGKNPKLTPDMINDSVNQTLSRTILTATTVFLVSIVLYVFGGEGVHLFAFVMVLGVLVGTYSSIFVAAPLLLFFGEGHDTTATQETATETKEEGSEEEEVVEG